jgi:hypothetical protein
MGSKQNNSERTNSEEETEQASLNEGLQILASIIVRDILRKNASRPQKICSERSADLPEEENI